MVTDGKYFIDMPVLSAYTAAVKKQYFIICRITATFYESVIDLRQLVPGKTGL